MIAGCLLSSPVFRTAATIGVEDTLGRSRTDVLRIAADLAVSRPVLLRAANHLIQSHAMLPEPGWPERFGLLAKVDSTNNQAVRLAEQLHSIVHALPGTGAAALALTADSPEAARSAQIATAVAEALVAQRDDYIADVRRNHDAATSPRLSALRTAAAVAHQRLTSLAGTDTDTAEARTAATAQKNAAEARVAMVRAIMAAGTPPLADGKDVPQSIDALQTSYLDLTRKLAAASQTLGDRHTTIIALREGVRSASASLTSEWQRLLRIAEADRTAARQREASLGNPGAADAGHQAAIDEARRAARTADDAVARAEAEPDLAFDTQLYHLVAPAPVPLVATAGWSLLSRLLLSLMAGAAAAGLGFLGSMRRGRVTAPDLEANLEPTRAASLPSTSREPVVEAASPDFDADNSATRAWGWAADPLAEGHSFFDPDPDQDLITEQANMPPTMPQSPLEADLAPDLSYAFEEIVADLVMVAPRNGLVPTIMVAANEIACGTTQVALGLAGVAVERGMRVLLVEGPRQRPELAAAAGPDCEPMLVDLYGNLRIVLQAEHSDALFLAPLLKNGTNIAAALARNTQASFLEDLASEFDIIVVDGCRAVDSAAAGLTADLYLRVGRFASRRETERFLKVLEVPPEAFVGTITGSSFVAKEPERDAWQPATVPLAEMPRQTEPVSIFRQQQQPRDLSVTARPAYPRRVAAR